MFSDKKISEFTNPVAKLDDQPNMSAQALKAWFDSSAEEVREKFNALVDELAGFADGSFQSVEYSAADGKLTFAFVDGTQQVVDLPLELLVHSGHYDADTQNIVLVLASGEMLTIPASDLVDVYTADEETLTLNETGGQKTFSVKDGIFTKEAPTDGVLYGRKNGAWAEFVQGLPELTGDIDTTYSGIYKYDSGILIAFHVLDVWDADEDGVDDLYNRWAYQLRITSNEIIKRNRSDEIYNIPEDGFPTDENGNVLLEQIGWYTDWTSWKGLYDDDIAAKQDLSDFRRRYDLTYDSAHWSLQPPETVDTSIFSTNEIYRVCRKTESGTALSGKFRLTTEYGGYANPITDADGNAIEFTVTDHTPPHNGIVSFNEIDGVYKFFTPDYRVYLYLPDGYIYDIYMVADVRGDLGGGTVMQHTLGSGKPVFFMNGSVLAGKQSGTLNMMNGITKESNYTKLYNHTQLTYSRKLIGCQSVYGSVLLESADARQGENGGASTYTSCAQAIDSDLTSPAFYLCLHPSSATLTAQERGVLFKGTKIYVTGRKINDIA